MRFEGMKAMRHSNVLGLICVALGIGACAHTEARRFPLREPMWRDTDLSPVSVACHDEPSEKDPHHISCAPEPRFKAIIWDGADNLLFRPLSESVGIVTSGKESVDVNSLDEVPDSSWFTNRLGMRPMTLKELELGRCTPDLILDGTTAKDGAWIIDKGKMDGNTDGFRVTVPGKGKYLFKADDQDTPEHGSAAQSVGIRIHHAVGYFVPCEQIVYFKPSVFTFKAGLRHKRNFQTEKPFTRTDLDEIFTHSPKRGEFIRMQASAWLPGHNVGIFSYKGTRTDDPNDVIPHEDRRELRAKRLLDAWLGRVDDRSGNTVDTWIADGPGAPDSSPGHVIHNILDTSEALGSVYDMGDDIDKRLGYAYVFDWGDVGSDFITLGALTNVWDTVQKKPGKEAFGYYNVQDFVPEQWKNEYAIAAFSRMTERDAAWMARILARFTPEMVKSLAQMAAYTRLDDAAYLNEVLEGRLRKILERYLTRISPITDMHIEGTSTLCGVDLAEWRGLRKADAFRYTAKLFGRGFTKVERRAKAVVCVALPHVAPNGKIPDNAPQRYVRVRIEDGVAQGPLIAHLYDLGSIRGYRLAGLERPEK
jgi:hypothetical protein